MIGDTAWQLHLGDYVTTLALSPDGDLLVAGSLAGDAVLVTVDGSLVRTLTEHPMGVLSAAWSPDGTRLAVGGHDGRVRTYDRDGIEIGMLAGTAWIAQVAWSPDGSLLAIADGRRLAVCDSDATLVHRFPAASSTITAVAWATNGRRVGITSYGGVSWYDTDHLPVETPSRTHTFKGSPLALALAPNGKWACAGFRTRASTCGGSGRATTCRCPATRRRSSIWRSATTATGWHQHVSTSSPCGTSPARARRERGPPPATPMIATSAASHGSPAAHDCCRAEQTAGS